MMRTLNPPASPPRELLFRRHISVSSVMRELWASRALVFTLAERDLRVRYKQAVLGFAWAVLTPLVLMLVFSVFFQRVARIDTGDVPYPIFAYVGLIPWAFFSASVSQGGSSIVANKALLSKVYCPREVFPIGSVLVAGVDAAASGVVLVILFLLYRFAPTGQSLWVPLLLAIQVMFTLGITLFVASVLVYLRDLLHALPLLLQLGLFATPVAYGMELIPERARLAYAIVNPLGPIIDGYRATALLGKAPDWSLVIPAAAASICWLVIGVVVFKRLETRFADVA